MPADRQPDYTRGQLRHLGPCGARRRCYRPECREAFGVYPSIEIVGGRAIFYCHRTVTPADAILLRMLDAA
jgi:hypothetical protein